MRAGGGGGGSFNFGNSWEGANSNKALFREGALIQTNTVLELDSLANVKKVVNVSSITVQQVTNKSNFSIFLYFQQNQSQHSQSFVILTILE